MCCYRVLYAIEKYSFVMILELQFVPVCSPWPKDGLLRHPNKPSCIENPLSSSIESGQVPHLWSSTIWVSEHGSDESKVAPRLHESGEFYRGRLKQALPFRKTPVMVAPTRWIRLRITAVVLVFG
jgi:hypothetical protein